MFSLTEIDEEEWQREWEAGHNTTYFQSPGWHRIWQLISSHTTSISAFKLRDGRENVAGVFPVFKTTEYGISRHFSSCAGTFGGLILPDKFTLNPEHIRQIGKQFANLNWRLSPECAPSNIESNISRVQADYTHRLDLTAGIDAIEYYWSRGKSGVARKAGIAGDHGITIRQAATANEWKSYYDIYLQNTKIWDPPPSVVYPYELFDQLRVQGDSYVKLWLAFSSDNQIISGALCLYSPATCVYWNGATDPDQRKLFSTNLLLCTAIRDSASRGLSIFDFNPSGRIRSVERFKESFGAEKAYAPVFDNRKGIVTAAAKLKSLFKKKW